MRIPAISGDRCHRVAFALIAVMCVLAACAIVVLARATGASAETLQGNGIRHQVRLTVAAPRVGDTAVDLDVTGIDGSPSTSDNAEIDVVMPQMGHAFSTVTPTRTSPGTFRAEAVPLPMSGRYEFTVRLHGPEGGDRVVFPLQVNG